MHFDKMERFQDNLEKICDDFQFKLRALKSQHKREIQPLTDRYVTIKKE